MSFPLSYKSVDARRASLRDLLGSKRSIKILEVHNPLSAIAVERAEVKGADGSTIEFDGFWSSSLTDSLSRGLPDNEILDIRARLENIADIFQVTSKPLIMDGDTGGQIEHFTLNVSRIERCGISAVVIEDKTGLKSNSLFGTSRPQLLADKREFARKIQAGKTAQQTKDFMIIARLESLIADQSMNDAIERAQVYVDAGADAIMIHSRKDTSTEVVEFAERFRALYRDVPLMCVPTNYSRSYAQDLELAGFNIIAYANHMLRAAFHAMDNVSREILRHGRTAEIEHACLAVPVLLDLIPSSQ